VIHADGEAGANGETGNASNANGDIAGGGGGSGGGGGGPVLLLYRTLTETGTIRSAGGTGGTGGGGREMTGGTPNVARATSNGGNGGAGQNGIVVKQQI
jgi:hypothetical protein